MTMTEQSNITVFEPRTPLVAPTPADLISQAVAKGAGIDVLKELMELQERHDRNQARKAFDAAIAEAKANMPVIAKNRAGHNTRYADMAAVAATVDPVLGPLGLSYRFRTRQDDRIHVTCILSHKAGHYEENTLSGPADTTGSKNAIQAIGSTLTYLYRYSLFGALGLASAVADDDDGKAAGNGASIEALQQKIVEVGADIAKVCKTYEVEKLEDIPPAQISEVIRALDAWARKQAKK